MRGQICFYDYGVAGQNDPRCNFAGLGIVEVPTNTWEEHVVRAFRPVKTGGGHLVLQFTGEDIPPPPSSSLHDCEMGDLLRTEMWPRPPASSEHFGGGILARKTRMPARNGHEIMSIVMLASMAPMSLTERRMYQIDGDHLPGINGLKPSGALRLSDPIRCIDAEKNGLGINSLLKAPIWGWAEEPVGFDSTLSLPTIDECMELEALSLIDERDPYQNQRYLELLKGRAGTIVQTPERMHSDPMFYEFRRRMHNTGDVRPWDAVNTRTQIEQRTRQANATMRELLASS